MAQVIEINAKAGGEPVEVRANRGAQGGLIRGERFKQSGPYGDLGAATLTNILTQAEQGNIASWAMLCDFIRGSDDAIAGLFETRRLRVRQAEIKIVAGRAEPTADDELAAKLCGKAIAGVENWDKAIDAMLLGQCDGASMTEIMWPEYPDGGLILPVALEVRHLRRFRYDEHWQPRLYDSGQNPGPDGYGEILDPNGKWITYHHSAGNVYPGQFGIMRSLAWRWLFRRWADRFWIEHLDRYGSPFTYAVVEKNTPGATRDNVRESLERLTSEHVAVFETGGEIVMEAAAVAAGSDQYETYMAMAMNAMATRILGTSDASAPGMNGSNAAVESRISAVVDPRTRADINELWSCIRRDLFRWVLIKNAHLFSTTPAIPDVKLLSDIGPETKVQTSALAGAQTEAAAGLIERAVAGTLPVSAARMLMQAANPTMTQEMIDAMFADVRAPAVAPAAPAAPQGVDTIPRMA